MKYALPTTDVAVFKADYSEVGQLDINAIGREGCGRVTAKVKGYWSTDHISLRINRRAGGWTSTNPVWEFEMSHSSGGRDTNDEPDSLTAEANFGVAMITLSQWAIVAREALVVDFEAAHQQRISEEKAAREAKAIAEQERFDADQPLGDIMARSIVNFITAQAQQRLWTEVSYLVLRRGKDVGYQITAKCNGTRVSYRSEGDTISRKALIADLAASSHRTYKE